MSDWGNRYWNQNYIWLLWQRFGGQESIFYSYLRYHISIKRRNNKLFHGCDAQMLLSMMKVVAKDYVAGPHIVSLLNIHTLMVFLTYFCSNPLYTSFVYTTTISFGLLQWCNQRRKIVLPSDNYGFCD